MNSQIDVTIRKRYQLVFSGKCLAITGQNDIGTFDILANHANFVTIVKEKLIVRFDKNPKNDMTLLIFEGGLLRAKENIVEVYIGI
jgi:F0F1-type ATP synthase epsilon subunit